MKSSLAAVAAALAIVSSTGCTAINKSCGSSIGCGVPCHMATSMSAPRATNLEGRCVRGPGLLGGLLSFGGGCGDCVGDCGPSGPFACGPGGCPPGNCQSCLNAGLGMLLDCPGGCHGCDQHYNFTPGPPTGQVAYPYYTTRGPRDFLMANPPSIGPR